MKLFLPKTCGFCRSQQSFPLISVFMFCWPVTLVCVRKITSKIDTETSQKFSHLLGRAKRGTRPVGFFTKGSPRILVGPNCFSKVPGFSQNVQFFLERSKWQRKGWILKQVKGKMQINTKKNLKNPGYSKNVLFFWKCSIVFCKGSQNITNILKNSELKQRIFQRNLAHL
jgi:hypothetical protein